MASFEPNNNNAIEVDGIRFETVVPETIITLPKRDVIQKLRYLVVGTLSPSSFRFPCPFISVAIGLRITNNTSTDRHFSSHFSLLPEFVGVEGAVPGGAEWISPNSPSISNFIRIQPGQTTTFFPEAAIFWRWGRQFVLSMDSGNGGRLIFEPLKSGSYQVRFLYRNTRDEETIYDDSRQEFKLIENIWTGEVLTSFIEFQLVRA